MEGNRPGENRAARNAVGAELPLWARPKYALTSARGESPLGRGSRHADVFGITMRVRGLVAALLACAPFPSSPFDPLPQQRTVLPLTPHEKSPPTSTVWNVTLPETATGVVLQARPEQVVAVDAPSCETSFRPQQNAEPEVVSAQAWWAPAPSEAIFTPGSTAPKGLNDRVSPPRPP